ncbi:N-terminal Xaa-Pro-Lys N-methyltransferase 1-B [Pectinophora gossypiella]|uniref:Alpha N-terminal protein methyltransferase 1 n=1 Tax=Pectinophora gossypiella TaxID=13191 RepID=A0A1E1WA95_PECGO|nr:N-terminal Xaa-Pro-Lys N-methyltransferase 1-B [Pectinophora gossypiella]
MEIENNIDYEKSLEYWADIPATVDGVLGGFGFISDVDIEGSTVFLKSLLASDSAPGNNTALDCGAGIGRITKHLLIPHFQEVDVVEPDEKFINAIKDFVGEHSCKIGKLYQVGLQEFKPCKKYDVIWNQWVLGYLTDEDLVSYLNRCREALTEGGVIIVKENVTSSGYLEKDDVDSSVTRSLKQFIKIFQMANLKRIKQCKQTNFPNGIYPVYMFALVPNSEINKTISTNESEPNCKLHTSDK